MALRTLLAAAVAATATLPAVAQSAWSAGATRCPLPEGTLGYPVSVEAADGTPLDPAYAEALVAALARRWEPPSRLRGSHAGLGRIRDRLSPPEPRWADDWTPSDRHVARVELVTRRGGGADGFTLVEGSGDGLFDRSLETVVRGEVGGAPALPPLPAGSDPVRVRIHFGGTPPAGAATVRFAAQQTPVRFPSGRFAVPTVRSGPGRPPPAGPPPSATIKYDVDAGGRVAAGSIQLLTVSDAAFGDALRARLLRDRFTPARSNCRAIPLTVVQRFGTG